MSMTRGKAIITATLTMSALLMARPSLAITQADIDKKSDEIASLTSEIDDRQRQTDELGEAISRLDDEIATTQDRLSDAKERLDSTLNTSYQQERITPLITLTSPDLIGTLVSRHSFRQRTSDAITQTITDITNGQRMLQDQRDESERARQEQQDAIDKLNTKKTTLESEIDELKAHLEDTRGQEDAITDADGDVNDTSLGSRLISIAMTQLGVPYQRNATEWGRLMDCSGFTYLVYQHAGIDIPRSQDYRNGREQSQAAWVHAKNWKTSISELMPGDIVFYGASWDATDHVGLYIGNGMNIEEDSQKVSIRAVYDPNWHPTWHDFIGGGSPI